MKNDNKQEDMLTDAKPLLSPVTQKDLLKHWDTAVVDLNRGNGTFKVDNVRLRDCSLNFNYYTKEYFVKFRDVTYGIHDIYNRR